MSEETKENITPNETDVAESTAEQIKDIDLEEGSGEDISKELQTAIAQKKHYREKLENLQKEYDSLQAKLPKKEVEPKESSAPDTDKFTALELKVENPNLSMDMIKKAMRYADVDGVSPQEIIKSSYFQAMVNEDTRSKRVEDAITDSSPRTGETGFNFEKVAADESGEAFQKLTQDQKKEFLKYMDKKSGKPGLTWMK